MTMATSSGKGRPGPALCVVETWGADFLAWAAQQRHLATELAATVLQRPAREAQQKVQALARVEPWPVAVALLGGASERLAAGEPASACALAELAVVAVEEMDTTAYPPSLKAGLLVHADLLLAESHHRAGQTEKAEEALERAETHLAETPPGGPRSRFLRLLRHFRRMQSSFERAQERLDSLVALLEERMEDFDV